MLEILERITTGSGTMEDLAALERIGKLIQDTALCGLGQGAPTPVLSTLKYFREEYEEHVRDKFCRAKACKGLGTYKIIDEKCTLCGQCMKACAFDAVKETRTSYFIDTDYCTKCKACYDVCPEKAIVILKQKDVAGAGGRKK